MPARLSKWFSERELLGDYQLMRWVERAPTRETDQQVDMLNNADMLRSITLLPLLAVVVMIHALDAKAQLSGTYRSESHGFSVALPDDWQQIPDSLVRNLQEFATEAGGIPLTYVVGFQIGPSASWFDAPYALIQKVSGVSVTPEELIATLRGSLDKASHIVEASGKVESVQFEQPFWDTTHDVGWMRVSGQALNGTAINGLSAYKLHRNGFVALHAYYPPGTATSLIQSRMLPVIQSLNFDPGLEYSQEFVHPEKESDPSDWFAKVLGAALVGSLFAVGAELFKWGKKRNSGTK